MLKKTISLWLCLILILSLAGCGGGEETTGAERKLQFTVTEAEGQSKSVASEYDPEILYVAYMELSDVELLWQGQQLPLEQLIRENTLSVPEILACAQRDAENGYCQESFTMQNSLTQFHYSYPECDLRITWDVYDTPANGWKRISELIVTQPGMAGNVGDSYYVDESSPWGYFIDREDWGLSFTPGDVSVTELTVDYTHEKNQEIGKLWMEDFTLYTYDTDTGAQNYLTRVDLSRDGGGIELTEAGSFTLSWEDDLGALEPGNYVIRATVSDHYDPEAVHPLMENFYDKQNYHITFAIS